MTRLAGGIWLAVVAGLALLAEALAVGLEIDSIHCVVRGDELCLSGDMMADYPPASLALALSQLSLVGVGVMGLALLPLALLALRRQGREHQVMIGATVALSALIPVAMLREYRGICDIPVEVNRLQYLAPAIVFTLLAGHIARRAAERWP